MLEAKTVFSDVKLRFVLNYFSFASYFVYDSSI
jgi:hypothetical protein